MIATLLLFLACATSPDRFAEDYTALRCQQAQACDGDTGSCERAVDEDVARLVQCDTYDADAADACLDERVEALDTLTCDEIAAGALDTPSCLRICG